jgi:hypothetical protein
VNVAETVPNRVTRPSALSRPARWLVGLCLVASSAGCILTKDLPVPALDVPDSYRAAKLTRQ